MIYSLPAYLREQHTKLCAEPDGEDSNIAKVQQDFLEKIGFLREYAETSYYDRIGKLYPFYTDHGKKHVESIHTMISEMLYPYKLHLNAFDIFILYTAIIYHDTGMSKSRKRHEKEMIQIFGKFSEYIKNRQIEDIIKKIAEAHTGSFDKLERLPVQYPISYNAVQEEIDARALASLLRFADEVSETVDRIDIFFLENESVPEENVVFWEYANCIKFSKALPQERKIKMKIDITNNIFYKDYKVPQKDGSIREMPFIDYLLQRLDKMDVERRNCCANFRHMVSIDAIDITMRIIDANGDEIESISPIKIELNEKYCERHSFCDAFYDKNPEIKNRTEYEKKLFEGA